MHRVASSTYGRTKAPVGHAVWQRSHEPQAPDFFLGGLGGSGSVVRISPRKSPLPNRSLISSVFLRGVCQAKVSATECEWA